MPHQCTKCGKIFPDAAEEILKGCSCGSRFFYYIRQEKFEELKNEAKEALQELDRADKVQIEQDIRELTGLDEKPDEPVILDLESVRVIRPGKFEIDIVNLFNKRRPLIYKLEEGKYIIDLASSLKVDKNLVAKKIRDPDKVLGIGADKEKLDEDTDEDDEEESRDEKDEIDEDVEDDKETDKKEIDKDIKEETESEEEDKEVIKKPEVLDGKKSNELI